MRTTLDIDDDVLSAAKDLARAEGKTMGEIISDLARRTLTAPGVVTSGMAEQGSTYGPGAWPSLPNRQGVVVTTELIERIQELIDREDAGHVDYSPAPVAPSRSESKRMRGTRR